MIRRYWTNVCQTCALKDKCTKGKERRVSRWQHEHVLEEVQCRLDMNPKAMRTRRETVEHPFGTIKARMGATHFLMKRLHNVKTEMSLAVLAYNLTRVMNIIGVTPLIAAITALLRLITPNRTCKIVWIALTASWKPIREELRKRNATAVPSHWA